MSHEIDKICIIMTLISFFVSKVCLLMSSKTPKLGPSRLMKNCLLNTTTPIFTVIRCICTKKYIFNLIQLAFSFRSVVMRCHSRVRIKHIHKADEAITAK